VDLAPCDRFDWERVIRRATILDFTDKGIALLLATFADYDGTRIFPGTQRLIAVSGRSKSVVLRSVRKLRDHGLIERVEERGKNGRKGDFDLYRLTIPVDCLGRLRLLDPDDNQVSPATPG
jgi:helix-turn-helix protein